MNTFFDRNRIAGFIIYPLGDLIAQIILGEVHVLRVFTMALAGGLIYAFEIPLWFGWINRTFNHWFPRTLAAIVYFNPLWIMRHILLIRASINPNVLTSGSLFIAVLQTSWNSALTSFTGAILISFVGNYIIQNMIRLERRFIASSIFSGLMAIYYAISESFFKG